MTGVIIGIMMFVLAVEAGVFCGAVSLLCDALGVAFNVWLTVAVMSLMNLGIFWVLIKIEEGKNDDSK